MSSRFMSRPPQKTAHPTWATGLRGACAAARSPERHGDRRAGSLYTGRARFPPRPEPPSAQSLVRSLERPQQLLVDAAEAAVREDRHAVARPQALRRGGPRSPARPRRSARRRPCARMASHELALGEPLRPRGPCPAGARRPRPPGRRPLKARAKSSWKTRVREVYERGSKTATRRPVPVPRAQRGERHRDRRRVVGEVVVHRHTARLAAHLEPPLDAAEGRAARRARRAAARRPRRPPRAPPARCARCARRTAAAPPRPGPRRAAAAGSACPRRTGARPRRAIRPRRAGRTSSTRQRAAAQHLAHARALGAGDQQPVARDHLDQPREGQLHRRRGRGRCRRGRTRRCRSPRRSAGSARTWGACRRRRSRTRRPRSRSAARAPIR